MLGIYFSHYELSGAEYEDNHCRISVRPLLQILRNIKTVLSCQLRLDAKKERLVVDMMKQKDIEITYHIAILEHENFKNFDPPQAGFST